MDNRRNAFIPRHSTSPRPQQSTRPGNTIVPRSSSHSMVAPSPPPRATHVGKRREGSVAEVVVSRASSRPYQDHRQMQPTRSASLGSQERSLSVESGERWNVEVESGQDHTIYLTGVEHLSRDPERQARWDTMLRNTQSDLQASPRHVTPEVLPPTTSIPHVGSEQTRYDDKPRYDTTAHAYYDEAPPPSEVESSPSHSARLVPATYSDRNRAVEAWRDRTSFRESPRRAQRVVQKWRSSPATSSSRDDQLYPYQATQRVARLSSAPPSRAYNHRDRRTTSAQDLSVDHRLFAPQRDPSALYVGRHVVYRDFVGASVHAMRMGFVDLDIPGIGVVMDVPKNEVEVDGIAGSSDHGRGRSGFAPHSAMMHANLEVPVRNGTSWPGSSTRPLQVADYSTFGAAPLDRRPAREYDDSTGAAVMSPMTQDRSQQPALFPTSSAPVTRGYLQSWGLGVSAPEKPLHVSPQYQPEPPAANVYDQALLSELEARRTELLEAQAMIDQLQRTRLADQQAVSAPELKESPFPQPSTAARQLQSQNLQMQQQQLPLQYTESQSAAQAVLQAQAELAAKQQLQQQQMLAQAEAERQRQAAAALTPRTHIEAQSAAQAVLQAQAELAAKQQLQQVEAERQRQAAAALAEAERQRQQQQQLLLVQQMQQMQLPPTTTLSLAEAPAAVPTTPSTATPSAVLPGAQSATQPLASPSAVQPQLSVPTMPVTAAHSPVEIPDAATTSSTGVPSGVQSIQPMAAPIALAAQPQLSMPTVPNSNATGTTAVPGAVPDPATAAQPPPGLSPIKKIAWKRSNAALLTLNSTSGASTPSVSSVPGIAEPEPQPSRPREKTAAEKEFDKYDRDHDGGLTKKETKKMMNKMGMKCKSDYLDGLYQKFDADHSGKIDVKEFEAMYNFLSANKK